MVCHPGKKAAVNTGYGLRGPPRTGAGQEDPELAFFGAKEERRRICADNAILMINIEHNRTIAYLVTIIKNICIIFSKRTRLLFPM